MLAGRLSLNRLVATAATVPAKMFGLYPRKGTIAPGGDADLVVLDPTCRAHAERRERPRQRRLLLLRGSAVRGGIELVMQRGQVLVADGVFLGRPGAGRFLPRGLPDFSSY